MLHLKELKPLFVPDQFHFLILQCSFSSAEKNKSERSLGECGVSPYVQAPINRPALHSLRHRLQVERAEEGGVLDLLDRR